MLKTLATPIITDGDIAVNKVFAEQTAGY